MEDAMQRHGQIKPCIVWLTALFMMGGLVGATPLYAQEGRVLPPGVGAEDGVVERTVEVPLSKINAALRRAQLPAIKRPAAPGADTAMVTLSYELPAPKRRDTSAYQLTRAMIKSRVPPPIAPDSSAVAPMVAAPDSLRARANPSVPALRESYASLTFDQIALVNDNNFFHIPPDPHGAVGRRHIVTVVNTAIAWYTKGGERQEVYSLSDFFAPLNPRTNTFDPKVLYDPFADRFVVLTLERTDASSDPNAGNTSFIFLAVSDDSDPNGAWYYQKINAKLRFVNANTGDIEAHWFDYPGFAFDEEAIYVTGNMFTFGNPIYYGGSRVLILAKGKGSGGLYDGGVSEATFYDPKEETNAPFDLGYRVARVIGAASSGVGTWLVEYSGLYSLETGVNFLSIVRIDDPLDSPSFTQNFVALGNVDDNDAPMPDAPQRGTTARIETNSRRALDAVWRDDALWMTTTIVPPISDAGDAGQATAYWVRVDTAPLGAPAVENQGQIGGEAIAEGTYTFFPSVAVNASGNAAFTFSASASTIYPGAYVTGRRPSMAHGATIGAYVLQRGEDYYVRTFGGAENRWGDYTAAVVDPTDGSFWFINQAALARGTTFNGESGRWGVFFGRAPARLPARLDVFSAAAAGGDGSVTLRWQLAPQVSSDRFAIRIMRPTASTFSTLAVVDANSTTDIYSYEVEDLTPGDYQFRILIDPQRARLRSRTQNVEVPLTESYFVSGVYPNPFARQAKLDVMTEEAQEVTFTLYDALGREVQVITERLEANQRETISFDTAGLASGFYIVRIQGETFAASTPAVRVR